MRCTVSRLGPPGNCETGACPMPNEEAKPANTRTQVRGNLMKVPLFIDD